MRHLSYFCALLLGIFTFSAVAKTELVVYTDIEPENLNKYSKAFQQQHPDITIKWVRDSAGPITARLLAEKDAPKADIIFGLSLNSVLALEPYGIFESYKPAGYDKMSLMMKDKRESPIWVGISAWASGFCINTKEIEKRSLPLPTTWQDLTKSEYKYLLTMPNPVSSSTGYVTIAAQLHIMGTETGWEYMTNLHNNIKMYTHSGCKPCQMAAQGEIAIGISSSICAKPFITRKAPLTIVIPTDGVGWDIESAVLLKASKNKVAARKLMDFATSEQAAKIAAENGYIPGRLEFISDEEKETQKQLINVDFAKSAAERDSILIKWREQFDNNK